MDWISFLYKLADINLNSELYTFNNNYNQVALVSNTIAEMQQS